VFAPFNDITRLLSAQTRSISAENPTGRKSGGAQARPPDARGRGATDRHCTPAASELGKGWKVRPCLLSLEPGTTAVLADIEGPGVVQHIWMTVLESVHRTIALRVYYDDQRHPSIETPLGDFFCNGIDGLALVHSLPIIVNPKGGMNSYWPMPFRRRIRIEVTNDGPRPVEHVFYQITYALRDFPDDTAYLHAAWRRSTTTRQHPEHTILDLTGRGAEAHGPRGRVKGSPRDGAPGTGHARAPRSPRPPISPSPRGGHYVGTYLVWSQLSNGWWGEGEVKFFIDGDPPDAPTICGTGTEDYFGGAWGFVMDHARSLAPQPYSTLFLGYPQALYEPSPHSKQLWQPRVPQHGLYRFHIPDPIRFERDLRVTIQALGWYTQIGKYQPLADDIASVAYWYQSLPSAPLPALPPLNERLPR
jgi:hypothetical protein